MDGSTTTATMDSSLPTPYLQTNLASVGEDGPKTTQVAQVPIVESNALAEGRTLSMKKDPPIEDDLASLPPIQRVPAEILVAIFSNCLPDGNARMSKRHPAVVLSHVCHDWRCHVVLSPALWCKIFVRMPPLYGTVPGTMEAWRAKLDELSMLFDVWTTRSGQRPLTLVIHIVGYNRIQVPPDIDRHLQPVFDSICMTSARWSSITLDVQDADSNIAFTRLFELSAEDLPILQTATVSVMGRILWQAEGSSLTGLLRQFPLSRGIFTTSSLRSLTLRGTWGSLHPMDLAKVWPPLTHLDLRPYVTHHAEPVLDFIALLHYLKSFPTLQSLTFALVSGPPLPLEPVDVSMASLTYLNLFVGDDPISPDVARYLSLPVLHTLAIARHRNIGPPLGVNDGLVGLIRKVGGSVRELSLPVEQFKAAAIAVVFDHLPNLEKLTSNTTAAWWENESSNPRPEHNALTALNGEGDHVRCPRLQHLTMGVQSEYKDYSIEEAFSRFLARRWEMAELAGCSHLRVVEVKLPYRRKADSPDVLQELRRKGFDLGDAVVRFEYP